MWDRTVPFEAHPPVWKGDQRVRLVKLVEKHVLTKPGPPLPPENDQAFSRISPSRTMKTIVTAVAVAAVVGLAVAYSSRAPKPAANIPTARSPEIRRAIPVGWEIRKAMPVQAIDLEIDSMSAPVTFIPPGIPSALSDSAGPGATAARHIGRPSVAEKRKVSGKTKQAWSSKRRLRGQSIFEKMARTFIATVERHPRKHYRSSRRKEPPRRDG